MNEYEIELFEAIKSYSRYRDLSFKQLVNNEIERIKEGIPAINLSIKDEEGLTLAHCAVKKGMKWFFNISLKCYKHL